MKTTQPLKRHIGDIMRPSTTLDSRGQLTGSDTTVATGVYFSLKPLNGREREIARQEFADASVLVTMHIDLDWSLTTKDKILRRSGPHSGRALNIGFIRDDETFGLDTEIVCGEGDLSNG
jgi:head-tail adaptor|tara:strand:+ start:112 stop:471 length:360 start_codon:yes stop_codon:yes gene_type:complete